MWPWMMPAPTASSVSLLPTIVPVGMTSITISPWVLSATLLAHCWAMRYSSSPALTLIWNFHSSLARAAVELISTAMATALRVRRCGKLLGCMVPLHLFLSGNLSCGSGRGRSTSCAPTAGVGMSHAVHGQGRQARDNQQIYIFEIGRASCRERV